MSKTQRPHGRPTGELTETDLPSNTRTLFAWLDEQPGFIDITREKSMFRMKEGRYGTAKRRQIGRRDVTETILVDSRYETTTRACYSSQKEVMDAWEDDLFAPHSLDARDSHLYTYSSYADGIRGPSTWSRWGGGRFGRGGQVPATEYSCSACGYSEQEASNERHRNLRVGATRAKDDVKAHIERSHPDADLHIENGHNQTEQVINFAAFQHADGTGRVEHYDRLAAIRTRNGLVIRNTQDFAKGMARLTYPDDSDAALPLTGLEELHSRNALYDITRVVQPSEAEDYVPWYKAEDMSFEEWKETHSRPNQEARNTYVVAFADGEGLLVSYDVTAKHRDQATFTAALEPEELRRALADPDNALDLLAPDEVLASEMDVVGSSDYGSPYSDEREGDVIIRQGEWFLVPDEEFEPTNPVRKPLPFGGPSWEISFLDTVTKTSGHPRYCAECGAQSFDWTGDLVLCEECDHAHAVAGYDVSASFLVSPDSAVFDQLDDEETPWEQLGSHAARDVTWDEDGNIYVRGSFRHTGGEHKMVCVEGWHRAIEHGRPAAVIDTSIPDRTSGRSSSNGVRYD